MVACDRHFYCHHAHYYHIANKINGNKTSVIINLTLFRCAYFESIQLFSSHPPLSEHELNILYFDFIIHFS